MKTLSYLAGLLILIQFLLLGIKQLAFILVERTDFTDRMASLAGMIILSVAFIFFAKKQKVSLSVFPARFSKFYIIGTCLAAIIFAATPANYLEGFPAVMLLLYGSIVTPVFEELIFRGYVWNKLNSIFEKEWLTYIVSVILFGLWHYGYIDSVSYRVEIGLFNIMIWKAITGLGYGIILGAVRLKTKNSYSTMLLHGVMNIFGR